jgi:hypothetical protein
MAWNGMAKAVKQNVQGKTEVPDAEAYFAATNAKPPVKVVPQKRPTKSGK